MSVLAAVRQGWATPGLRALGTDVFLAALVALPVVLPAHLPAHLPVVCPLRTFTGLPCPGCGLTRSFIALGHLHVADAFTLHPLGPPFYALVLSLLAWRLLERLRGRLPTDVEALWRDRRARRLLLPAVALWVTWAVVRAAAAAW
jgi:hypothetical protein